MNKYQLILGSASPRRKELLGYTFCPFQVLSCETDEVSSEVETSKWVMDIARVKAVAAFNKACSSFENPFVIGSDTIVVKDGLKLGKPKDRDAAIKTLTLLSGSTHDVLTGVSFKTQTREHCFYQQTQVEFDIISKELLEMYLDTGESFDKAGAYGIQAYGLSFVKSIKGSYSNVVGFPVSDVLRELESFVKKDYPHINWREAFEKISK